MTKGVQRAPVLTALFLSLIAVPCVATAKTTTPADAKPGKEVTEKRPATKPAVATGKPAPAKSAPKTASVAAQKPDAPKAPTPKPAAAKTGQKTAQTKSAPTKPVTVKASIPKSAPKAVPVKAPPPAAAEVIPASAAPLPPGCVPNLVDADFQTLPVTALEGINRRLEGLGLTRAEADSSLRTLTERAGGSLTGGSVIVARYVDSCDPRRVQVISVSLALDGPVSYTWLRGTNAPATLVAEPAPLAPLSAPVTAAAPTVEAPVAVVPVPDQTLPAPAATVAVVSEPPAAPPGEVSRETARLEAFSVGPFTPTPTPEGARRVFTDAPPEQAPLGFHLRVAGQVQEGDLGPALAAAGLPTSVVQQVLDSFAADGKMPLASTDDLSFDVLYRASSDQTAEPVLTSAELSHAGQSRRLYYYVPEEGTAHLIDQEGKVRLAQGPDFIHPLPGQRMTSGFGWRMHPVLRARKFHKGVDWSAPRGTPVVAAGDGIVETVKFHRGYGKYIRIVHDDRTETIYAHLDQFAKGLREGAPVRQGQVIGTVGRTGIASGNHLYFELIVDGRHIDPLRNVPALVQDMLAEGKDKEDQQRFISFADTLLQQLPANATVAEAAATTSKRGVRSEPAPGDIP